MRYLILTLGLLCALSACAPLVVTTSAPAPGPVQGGREPAPRAAPAAAQSPRAAIAAFDRSVRRIEPVAEQLCRVENPQAPARDCNFRFQITNDPRLGQNAFQSIGRDGRPEVTFTQSLLTTLRNDDEVAFILGHETAHQILGHIRKSAQQQQLGAVILGGLVASTGRATNLDVNRAANLGAMIGSRVYSKRFELESDVLATYIAEAAGYDPVRGAAPFGRMETGSNGFLSTHPPSSDRLATVQRTAAQIAAARRAGQAPRVPRF